MSSDQPQPSPTQPTGIPWRWLIPGMLGGGVLGGTGGATLDDIVGGLLGKAPCLPAEVEIVEVTPCEDYAELLEERLAEALLRCLEAEVAAYRAAQDARRDCATRAER